MTNSNEKLQAKKSSDSFNWIFWIFLIIAFTVEDIVWKDSFLVYIIRLTEYIGVKAFVLSPVILMLLILFYAIFKFYKIKKDLTALELLEFFNNNYANKLIVAGLLCLLTFHIAGRTSQYTDIERIIYYHTNDKNEVLKCGFSILSATFKGDCEGVVKEIKEARNSNKFLKVLLEYAKQDKIDIWDLEDDEINGHIVYVKDKGVFNSLLFNVAIHKE